MAEKSIGETAFEFFNNLFLERDPRNSILDPMTCIIRLGILSFRQRGTKISVIIALNIIILIYFKVQKDGQWVIIEKTFTIFIILLKR